MAHIPPTAAEMNIATIISVAKCSEEEAEQYLAAANGDLQQAVLKSLTPIAQPVEEPPCAPSLLDDALEAYAAKLQKLKVRDKGGDVLILLDSSGMRACRLFSDDMIEASPALASLLELEADNKQDKHGVRHLLTLARDGSEGFPTLARHDLDAPRAEIDRQVSDEAQTDSKVKLEHGEAPTADAPTANMQAAWIDAYESMFRMIANFPAKHHGISQESVEAALPEIEMIAQVVEHYSAASPDSPLTRELERLCSSFINAHQLWHAIAKDAARWLILSVRLQSTLVYNEAFVHVAGAYPAWPWTGVKESTVRVEFPLVYQAIVARSRELQFGRQSIERMLMCKTITCAPKSGPDRGKLIPVSQRQRPIVYSVLNIWRDWITSHIAQLDSGYTYKLDVEDPLCKHASGECLNEAGFHRTVGRGGDAYLPSEPLIEDYWEKDNFPGLNEPMFRNVLKELKEEGAKVVAPLLKSYLQYDGRDKLPYLTCIRVSEEDVPWWKGGKKEVDEDGDEEMS
ncbi:hypothetical protein DOTSEDRAFT_72311 [Dothistroma septosporum NZE10]|uniref:Uncharacterized protein n=1 Tax=Dothistroma septosporum (strain NZE10 / CBS 128990) TaxID=675120 RepID=M2YLK6_DOTSN|nr:hypothetical protein DOTSEDRAFT_72311 [Dothistroma septosporum NZE10]